MVFRYELQSIIEREVIYWFLDVNYTVSLLNAKWFTDS
jgi:hypothetical protein